MSSSPTSFVNGLIAGAGAVLAFMSVAFFQIVAPVEGISGITTTEIRVAILLGGLVCAAAVGYEFYSKKHDKQGKVYKKVVEYYTDSDQESDQAKDELNPEKTETSSDEKKDLEIEKGKIETTQREDKASKDE